MTIADYFDRIHFSVVPLAERNEYDFEADVEEAYLDVGVAYLEWCEKRSLDVKQVHEELWQRWEQTHGHD